MRSLRLAAIAAALMLAVSSGAALADSGSYTSSSGENCYWTGSGHYYNISCSGFSRGQYVNYNCDVETYGYMTSWRCRDLQGNTWSGSR